MKNFTIANLMTGDMIQTRNGKYATVMKNTPIGDVLRYHTTKDSFSYIAIRYNDNMTHKDHSTLDIMKVYRMPEDLASNVAGDVVANPAKMVTDKALIWDRENPVFDLTDLITGDMIKTRSGKYATVYLNTPIGDIVRYHTTNDSFSYLKNFTRDMRHVEKTKFDIVEVYRSQIYSTSEAGDAFANVTKMVNDGNLVYRRDDYPVAVATDADVDDIGVDEDGGWDTAITELRTAGAPSFSLTDEQFDRLLEAMWG